jgi:hypothetical protein
MTRQALHFLACVLALAPACGSGSGEVDGGNNPPRGEITLLVSSPAPGAELALADDPAITVAGAISTTDPAGVLEIWINGEPVPVAADGSFATALAAELGINHIKVEGRDGKSAPVEQRMDVLWAPDYLASLPGSTGFDLPGALELRLGQRFFDTRLFGTDLDLDADPVVAGDLASVLELVLWHMDLAQLLEEGIHFGEGDAFLDVDILTASKQGVVVDARIIDGAVTGLDLHIDLLGVFLAMDGEFGFGGNISVIEGGIAADLHASARLTLEITPEGRVAAAISDVQAGIGPLTPMFEGPDGEELNALIALGESDFRALVEGLIAEELIPTFTDGLPALAETLLGAMDDLLSDLSFVVDTGLGEPVTLLLDGAIGGLEVVAGPPIGGAPGHVTVRQDLTIRTSGVPVHPRSRGAPRADSSPELPFTNAAGLHLAVRQDFVNALLHALWNGGLLAGEVALGGLSATVNARLPPVVRPVPLSSPCRIDGERCDLILQLGQIEVTIDDFAQSFAVGASAGARIVVDGGAVSLVIQEVPELRVWEISAEPGILSPEAVEELIERLVWPRLFGAIGDNLVIPLPLPDLAELGLGAVAPGLADAALALVARQRPTVASGYLGLAADLVLEAPQP